MVHFSVHQSHLVPLGGPLESDYSIPLLDLEPDHLMDIIVHDLVLDTSDPEAISWLASGVGKSVEERARW
jgi:hypothetical protein